MDGRLKRNSHQSPVPSLQSRSRSRSLAAALLAVFVADGLGWTIDASSLQSQDASLPELIEPVNDFAQVIDPASASAIEEMSRALKAATGDVVVVATVPTIEPYADIREYATRLFENNGRGIGDKGKDNGLLILLAVKERRVWVEVGYAIEQWVTDGFAGETSRSFMAPAFREGRYGEGLREGSARLVARIAQGRNVTVPGVRVPDQRQSEGGTPVSFSLILLVFLAILVLTRIGGGPRGGIRRWGDGGWSGWSSGVGPFGGGGGGGFGGGGAGFGGGFGGFGGGRSGGGGGGAGW